MQRVSALELYARSVSVALLWLPRAVAAQQTYVSQF